MAQLKIDLVDGKARFALAGFLGGSLFSVFRECIAGARYEPSDKSNRAPLDKVLPILQRLTEKGFTATISDELRAALIAFNASNEAAKARTSVRADTLHAELEKRGKGLFGFQRIGANELSRRRGFLLMDQMGIGKTMQALVAAEAPVLVIGPAVVKGVWVDEAQKWRPDLRVTRLEGRGSLRAPEQGELVVTNYDIVHAARPETDDGVIGELKCPFEFLPNTTLIFDEAHALKSHKSQRTRICRVLAEAVRAAGGSTWALTATPLLGKPPELWAVLQVIGCAQEAFRSYKDFVALFGGYEDKFGGMHWGKVNAEVPERLRRVSLRRERKDVLKDLPEKMYRDLDTPIDRSVKKLCDQAWEDLQKSGIDLESAEELAAASKELEVTLETVSKARKALATSKLPTLLDLIDQYEQNNEPVVVFSRHRAPIDALKDRPGWAHITGDNSKHAQEIAADFQAGKYKGLAGTIQAAGVGITLTYAAHVIFIDQDWTPALNEQAEDRCCRIGQTRGVVVTRLVADHMMDRHLAKVLGKKMKTIANSIEASTIGAQEIPEGASLDVLVGF